MIETTVLLQSNDGRFECSVIAGQGVRVVRTPAADSSAIARAMALAKESACSRIAHGGVVQYEDLVAHPDIVAFVEREWPDVIWFVAAAFGRPVFLATRYLRERPSAVGVVVPTVTA